MESFVQSFSLASTMWVSNLVKDSGTVAPGTQGILFVSQNLVLAMASGQSRHDQIAV